MTTETLEMQTGAILLAEVLDIDAILTLRHLARQFRQERTELQNLLTTISSKSLSEQDARIAAVYWALGDNAKARTTASKCSDSALAQVLLGVMAEGKGDFKAALACYKKSAVLAPSSPQCVLRQLSAMNRLGQAEEALVVVEKLRREFSDRPLLHYYEGRCREELSEYDEALECYQNALELEPNHAETLFAAARLCDLRGLDTEAKEYYKRIGPAGGACYVNACLNLALILEDESDFDGAMACCQSVLKVDPNHKRAKLFLSDAQSSSTMFYSPEETKQSERLEAVLRVPVSDFELSVRSRNCLSNMDIQNLGDLVKKTESEMLAYKNFGETSLREIKEMLSSRGLRLGMMREDAATRAAMERARVNANQELLGKHISEMELGVRSRKCMDNMGIVTIGDLCSLSEMDLATAKNFGRVSLNEIKKRLVEMGLSLNDSK